MDPTKVIAGAILGACITSLAACSSTGGDIGGLVPAPKFLKGDIANNVYTAQDKRFTVAVPHAQGSYEYTYMHVKEEYGQYNDYVSFGPAAFDQSIYRIDYVTTPPGMTMPSLDVAAQRDIAAVEEQAETAYEGAVTAGDAEKVTVGGRPAYHWQLKQTAPSGKLANVDVALIHEVYMIDFGNTLATVWVQTQVGSTTKDAPTPEQFAESFKVTGPSQP